MNVLRQIAGGWSRWMDAVAAGVVAVLGRLVAPRVVRLTEQANGTFAIEAPAGKPPFRRSRLRTALRAVRRSRSGLERQPGRAGDAAGAIFFPSARIAASRVGIPRWHRACAIDRITPWDAGEAVVGWSQPVDVANDKISVTVAAAPRAPVVPLTQPLSTRGKIDRCLDDVTDAKAPAIRVFEQSAAGALELARSPSALAGFWFPRCCGAGHCSDVIVGGSLQSRQNDVSRRIAERRGNPRAGNDAVANSALAKLARRKNQTPARRHRAGGAVERPAG